MVDLKGQYQRYRSEIDAAVARVLASQQFLQGPEVDALERELAAASGARHVVCCSSGTDALVLALMALGVGPGDEVIVPDFTFAATATSVLLVGAKPVLADVRFDDFTLDPQLVERYVTRRTAGVISVSLFGQCGSLNALARLCAHRKLFLIEDAAQSFGATVGERHSCAMTSLATTSFYPSKPLGAYGNGGAVFATDSDLAERVRSIGDHGRSGPYRHQRLGVNARLDSVQAAVLRVKLSHFDAELVGRRWAAQRYTERLGGVVIAPRVARGASSSWAQYTVRIPQRRDRVADYLKLHRIQSAVYYPIPLHRQPVFSRLAAPDHLYPVANTLAGQVLSLPIGPFLEASQIDEVAQRVKEAL